MPYFVSMHAVISTQTFLVQSEKCKILDDELEEIVSTISDYPQSGDLIADTGGARKLRHPKRGKGKSGGYRTIHYYAGDDVPVFLLSIYEKGTTASLTKSERNALAKILPQIAEAYRK